MTRRPDLPRLWLPYLRRLRRDDHVHDACGALRPLADSSRLSRPCPQVNLRHYLVPKRGFDTGVPV